MFDLIAFDADDTLWHNETIYSKTQDEFIQLLSKHHSPESINQQLYQTEMRNLEYYGYGIKGFVLSMIETAIKLTEGEIRGVDIQKIVNFSKEMRDAKIQLLEHVEETVLILSEKYKLIIITKGDQLDQETKITRSGIGHYFKYVEIVSEKTQDTYKSLLAKYQIEPGRFLMIGNSLKSDILPVVDIGGKAIYIPYHITWNHEVMSKKDDSYEGYVELEHIGLVPKCIKRLVNR